MTHFRNLLLTAALAVCVTPAFAQSAPPQQDGGRHHEWMEQHKGDRTAWHARMCTDMYAHRVGMVAELGAKLDLTDSQRPLFERWKGVVLENAKSHQSECAAHTPDMGHRPTLLEREAHMREHLKGRLAAMDAQAPALDALYNSLNPAQKMELDHMGHHGMRGGHGMMHHGFGGMHGGHDGPDGPDGAPPSGEQG